jgi:RNA polymerase sigma-70 factor (ECF subfamily)
VAEVKSGDDWDFEAVHREFRLRIGRYLRHLAGEAEADDLTQAVFLKVSLALPAFRGESSLSTWIYRIATNVARDHARASGRWSNAELESIEHLPDPVQEADDRAYIRQEMRNCIRELVECHTLRSGSSPTTQRLMSSGNNFNSTWNHCANT